MTLGLFSLVGPKRTRLISQIVAGIVGAGFVIGIQAVAILSYGNMSRFSVLDSPEFIAASPGLDSLVWLPARAAMGDLGALADRRHRRLRRSSPLVIAAQLAQLRRHAVAAAGVSRRPHAPRPSRSRLPPAHRRSSAAPQGMEAPRAATPGCSARR